MEQVSQQPYQQRSAHFEALFNNPDLIWMGQNTNHLPAHPDVKRAMIAAIEDETFHVYAPPAGMAELRRLIVEDLGLASAGADVLITDGAIEGLYHACRHVISPGDRMITTDPTWTWPGRFAQLSGAQVIALPIYEPAQDYRLTADQLAAAVADGGARLIYIVDPLNPLGICYTAAEIEQFAAIARDADAYLIHDCTYRHFAEGHTLAFHYYPERTITTYSFSKWLGGAGLRLGALMATPALLEGLSDGQPNSLGSNVVSQLGAIAGLKVKADWFPEVQRISRHNQDLIYGAVGKIDGLSMPIYPSHGNFVSIDCHGALSTGALSTGALSPEALSPEALSTGALSPEALSTGALSPEALCDGFLRRNIMIRHAGYHTERYADRFIKVSTTVPIEHAERFCELLPAVVAEARAARPTADRHY